MITKGRGYRLVERDPNDTSGGNVAPIIIPTCDRCERDLTEFDGFDAPLCEDCAVDGPDPEEEEPRDPS